METKRQPELTAMTGMAIVMVLLIHAGGSCLGTCFPGMSYLQAGKLLHVFSLLVSPAVPMFIFLAGYKFALRDKETSYPAWLKKRLPRVLMSFFIINTLFWLLDSIVWMDSFDPILLLKTYISSWMGNTVAYPLFFELGIQACEKNWGEKLERKYAVPVSVFGCYVVTTFAFPMVFSTGITAYLCDIMGVVAAYVLSLSMKHSHILAWFAAYSYPIFLLHEPIIGRCTGALLRELGIFSVWYIVLWFAVVLAGTMCVILLLKKTGFNKVLWEFEYK